MSNFENLKGPVVKVNLANLHNKLGACTYRLFVLATFFPFMTIDIWGMIQSVSGTEIIDTSVIVLMPVSILLRLSGAPKWLAKGISVLSIVYFYYFSKVIEMLSVGFWLILASFISMKGFVFMPYTESVIANEAKAQLHPLAVLSVFIALYGIH